MHTYTRDNYVATRTVTDVSSGIELKLLDDAIKIQFICVCIHIEDIWEIFKTF